MWWPNETAATQWRWMRPAWIVGFLPIGLGMLAAGVFGYSPALLAALCWFAALGCVLRMLTLRHHSSVRGRLAGLGWSLAGLALIGLGALAMQLGA